MIPLNNSTQFEALAAVQRERQHQEQKYGPLEARTETFEQHLQVLSKELDEVKAALATNDALSARCELMQVAAVAVAMLERFGVSQRSEWPYKPNELEFPIENHSADVKSTVMFYQDYDGSISLTFPEHDKERRWIANICTHRIVATNRQGEAFQAPAAAIHLLAHDHANFDAALEMKHFYYPVGGGKK